jgi:hypothetical protein
MNTYEHFTYSPKPALLTRVANGLWSLAGVVTV